MPNVTMSSLKTGAAEGTPVVLMHGYTGDRDSWRLVAPALEKDRPVIMVDLPSHGQSPIWIPDSFEAFVEEVAGNLEEIAGGPFHLVGHSLGGAISFALSDKMRGSIKSLTTVSPAGLGREVDDEFISNYPSATDPDEIGKWAKRVVGKSFELPEVMPALIAEKRNDPLRIDAQVKIGRLFFPDGTQAIDVTGQASRVDVPCKLVFGKQDTLIPWEHALNAPAHVGLHLMPEVGHMPNVEAPQLLAALIRETIQSAGG